MDPILVSVAGFLIVALLTVNAFFVKKLVEKLDETERAVNNSALQVTALKTNVDAYSVQINDLKTEVRELRKIEVDVKAMQLILFQGRGALISQMTNPNPTI
jgi:F0F1-type ATP synthase membrane subunit b/b'